MTSDVAIDIPRAPVACDTNRVTMYHIVSRDGKDEKKQRVLHTRIPESLEEELKDHAAQLGVSVSNLVRNVLSNAFDMVDDIVADSRGVADSVRPGARRRSASRAQIIGWQPLVLNVNALCDACNGILPKGSAAHLAVWEGSGTRTVRCKECVDRLGDTGDTAEATHADEQE